MIQETGERKIGWNVINTELKDTITAVTSMKFQKPRQSPEYFKKYFGDMYLRAFSCNGIVHRRPRMGRRVFSSSILLWGRFRSVVLCELESVSYC